MMCRLQIKFVAKVLSNHEVMKINYHKTSKKYKMKIFDWKTNQSAGALKAWI